MFHWLQESMSVNKSQLARTSHIHNTNSSHIHRTHASHTCIAHMHRTHALHTYRIHIAYIVESDKNILLYIFHSDSAVKILFRKNCVIIIETVFI